MSIDKNANLISYARFGNTSNSLAVNAHITNDGSLLLGGWFRASTDINLSLKWFLDQFNLLLTLLKVGISL